MTEKENPSGGSGPGTRTIEPSWDEESGNAAANEDAREDELGTEQEDTDRDDATLSGAAYPTGSAEDEDEAQDETLDETDVSVEAAEVDEADEAARAQRADGTEGSDEFGAPAGYGETTGYGENAASGETAEGLDGVESTEDAEATDLTGYLPAYREPSATEPDAESEAVPEALPGALSEPPPPASATPVIPGGPGLPGSVAGALDAAGDQSERMREIQLGFVDNPRRAALDAQELLLDALQSLTEESVRERDALRGSVDEANPDTERMRLAVRRARELIDAVSSRY